MGYYANNYSENLKEYYLQKLKLDYAEKYNLGRLSDDMEEFYIYRALRIEDDEEMIEILKKRQKELRLKIKKEREDEKRRCLLKVTINKENSKLIRNVLERERIHIFR